jgi:hypothetical protein
VGQGDGAHDRGEWVRPRIILLEDESRLSLGFSLRDVNASLAGHVSSLQPQPAGDPRGTPGRPRWGAAGRLGVGPGGVDVSALPHHVIDAQIPASY